MSLKDELRAAAHEADRIGGRLCGVCTAMLSTDDPAEQELLGGRRIGENKLAEILTRNGFTTSRRMVAKHRREGHQPV